MFANLTTAVSGIAPLPGEDLVDLAVRHGFGGLDLPLENIQSIDQASMHGERIRKLNLRWGLFWLPCDFPTASDETYRDGLRQLRQQLPLVKAAGCTRTYSHLMPGDNAYNHDALVARYIERLRPVADTLGEFGVTYGLEFIGPATLRRTFRYPSIHSLSELLPLLDALGPHVGIVLDTFHWWTSGGTLDELQQLLPNRSVVNVHVSDAVIGRSREQQLDGERELAQSTGLIDSRSVLRILHNLGYDGPVISEPFSPHRDRLAMLSADEAASEVAMVLRRVLPGRADGMSVISDT